MNHIGNIAAYVDAENGVSDVSILIGEKEAWGKGYGEEAFREVCRHLLSECGMRKISAGTMSENTAMLKVMRAVGMTEDGRRVGQLLYEGKAVDMVHYALFNTSRGEKG